MLTKVSLGNTRVLHHSNRVSTKILTSSDSVALALQADLYPVFIRPAITPGEIVKGFVGASPGSHLSGEWGMGEAGGGGGSASC